MVLIAAAGAAETAFGQPSTAAPAVHLDNINVIQGNLVSVLGSSRRSLGQPSRAANGSPLDSDIEKLLPAALYKKGFDLCAAFSTKPTTTLPRTRSCTTLDEGTARSLSLLGVVNMSGQYFLRCEPRSAWPDHPNNSRGLNAFDSFVEEAVLKPWMMQNSTEEHKDSTSSRTKVIINLWISRN